VGKGKRRMGKREKSYPQNDLVCRFSPVHAEIYDFTSFIPCTATESMLIPDDLSVRCHALKWRTYFGLPYINLLGKETILNAPCWKTEESVDPKIRAELGRGFLFRPYYASEKYDREKKLVPEFPIRELFGKNLPEEFEHGL